MSWETFVVGTLEIAPDVPEEMKAKLVEDFKEILETDLTWNDEYKIYMFLGLNLYTHGIEEDITECYQKHKRHIKRISLSLWYLSEADFNLHVDASEHEQMFCLWHSWNATKVVPALDYLFGTLLPLRKVSGEMA